MAFLTPNNGEGDMLKYLLNFSAPENLVLRLFQNNITPSETDTAATYTEATWTGYAAVTLPGASWTIVEGAPSVGTFALQTFTSTAGSQNQSNYGYFLTRVTSGRIALAERFSDGPYVIVNNGDQVKVSLSVGLD